MAGIFMNVIFLISKKRRFWKNWFLLLGKLHGSETDAVDTFSIREAYFNKTFAD